MKSVFAAFGTLSHRLPVAARLGLGFALLLAILGIVAWKSHVAVGGVAERGDQVAADGTLATEVSRASGSFAKARIGLREFLLTSEPVEFARAVSFAAQAKFTLGNAARGAAPAQATAVQGIDGQLTAWMGTAMQLRMAWIGYSSEVDERFFPQGTALTAEARRLVDVWFDDQAISRAALAFIDARAGANRFLHRGDRTLVTPTVEWLRVARETAETAARQTHLPAETQAELTALASGVQAYAAVFQEVARLRAEAERIRVGVLAPIDAQLDADMEHLQTALAGHAATTRTEANALAETATQEIALFSGGAILAGLVLALTIAISVTWPLRRLTASVARIAAGETKAPVVDQQRRDEMGAMARALEVLRGQVGRAYASQQMLEQIPIGVMVTDPNDDFRITYMNPQSASLLGTMEAMLPMPVDKLLGQSVDVLHRNPGHQRAILSDPTRLPHKARIRLGHETLDLTVSAVRDRDGAYTAALLCWNIATAQAQLADRFETDVGVVVEALAAAATQVQQAAGSLSASAETSGLRAVDVAEAGQEAGAEVQSVAASAEELASSIAEITRQVAEGAAVARAAADEARATNTTVEGLATAAARINDVVRLIGDIAGQTNLLALNATIEAARAGEAGKGFAVVASEVKALAGQTARATQEIGDQIAAVQKATAEAVTALRSIGGTVGRMEEVTSAIAAAVEQQGAATREIARTAAKVAGATDAVVARISEVREGTEATGIAAGGLVLSAQDLATQTASLREKSGRFLAAVRAA